jgi:hypothetical protein
MEQAHDPSLSPCRYGCVIWISSKPRRALGVVRDRADKECFPHSYGAPLPRVPRRPAPALAGPASRAASRRWPPPGARQPRGRGRGGGRRRGRARRWGNGGGQRGGAAVGLH